MNNHPHRLRPGDLVHYAGQSCPVLRVTPSSAVLALARPARQFQTRFGARVQFHPRPAVVHISPNSEIPILNR